MAEVNAELTTVKMQLRGGRVGTPATVEFRDDSISIEVVAGEKLMSFQFALMDTRLMLIERVYTETGADVNPRKLHDWAD